MKTKILVATLLAGLTSYSFAASNVTLYGQIDLGVVASKAKHKAATFEEKSGFVGMSRWVSKALKISATDILLASPLKRVSQLMTAL